MASKTLIFSYITGSRLFYGKGCRTRFFTEMCHIMRFKYLSDIQICEQLWLRQACTSACSESRNRVKSGNFGHQVKSDIHLQTVEIQMRRLIRIFTVCYSIYFLFQKSKYETNKVAVRIKPTIRIYPTVP